MNEKTFFHNALESDLLSGGKQKRRLDAALGRTQVRASVHTQATAQSRGGIPRWVCVPAVAALLALTALVAVFVGSDKTRESRPATPVQSGTPVEAQRPVVLSNSAEIRLLSEIDAAQQFTETREGFSALPAYHEADWEWLKDTTVRVSDFSATASTINWTTELRVPKRDHAENPFLTLADVTYGMPLCFFRADSGLDTPDTGAQLVEYMLPGDITYSEDDNDWIVLIPEVCAMPQVYDQFPAALPPTGEVTIKNKLFVLDREAAAISSDYLTFALSNGETEEYPVSMLGTIEHTFTFDAEALLNIADPAHIEVPLSGEYVLSIHENNGFHNERVSLDGVTLDAEVHYTVEGVVVILSIKDTGVLSDAEQESLYLALSGGPDGTGDLPWAYSWETDSSYRVYALSRTFWGTTRFARYLIEIDPADYAAAKSLDFRGNLSYAVGEANAEPHEDWSWNSANGALPELLTDCKQLPTLSIPLPEVPISGSVTSIPEPTVPQDDKVAICVYFYDGDADDAINEQFKAQYPELYNAFMYTEWGLAPQVQLAIQMKAQIADAYFTEKNRERCLQFCDEEDIVFLSSNDAVCIIRVPYEKFSEIRRTPGVTHIEIFEDMTSAASVADSSPLSLSAALSELLETEAPETVVNIQFYFSYGSALEDAFLYDGKTLTDYRNQPALRARSNEYEGWYYNEYRKLDEQNRDTPGWEKHDPEELFDAYWRERHTEEEIRAHEQAFEAYKKALNAFSEWRDGEGGQEAFRTILQQECDRLNALGFSLHVTEDRQIEGTATVKQLLDFPAKEGHHYWISLIGDNSPIDE